MWGESGVKNTSMSYKSHIECKWESWVIYKK